MSTPKEDIVKSLVIVNVPPSLILNLTFPFALVVVRSNDEHETVPPPAISNVTVLTPGVIFPLAVIVISLPVKLMPTSTVKVGSGVPVDSYTKVP